MTTLETTLEIKNWDEKPYRELPDGSKYARAEVTLVGSGPLEDCSFEALLYYRADGTSTYLQLMTIAATLDGRRGSLILAGEGSYDGKTAKSEVRVIEATGELAGVTGKASSTSTHADYPHMPLKLTYDFA